MLDRARLPIVLSVLLLGLTAGMGRTEDVAPPSAVKVLPVFFVPKGEAEPTDKQSKKLMKHLEWAQTRYKEMLKDRDTFEIAEEKPRVFPAARPLGYYREQKEDGAPQVVGELLAEWKLNRFNCPYIFFVVVLNPKDEFPPGGGRPFNGGLNTGGGIIQMSSFAMDKLPYFQSTLQHELGHAFGLAHVDTYGYDMKTNTSIMSYNKKHDTKDLTASKTPGVLIPEDLRALALNRRVFHKLKFDPTKDVPANYKMAEKIVPLGPMKIADQPDGPKYTTSSGEEFGSKVANLATGPIGPNVKGKVTFDAATMWQSAASTTGWVTVDVAFPYEVELSDIGVHSQHSGDYHAARSVRVSAAGSKEQFKEVALADLKSTDDKVSIPKTKARVWRFDFQAGGSNAVVLRGLRFYSGGDELFPPLVPNQP